MEDSRPEWGRKCSKGCLLPIRVVVAIMGFFALICAYTNRVSISHVITVIVKPHNRTEEQNEQEVCPKEIVDEPPSSKEKTELYDWDESLQGYILGSFYIGYLICHVPGGVLADLFGGKWVLGISVLLSGLCCVFSAPAIQYTGKIGLIAIRILMGCAQGPVFPALTTLLSAWLPKNERATLGTMCYSGVTAGTVISNSFSGVMLHNFKWQVTLIVFGVIAIFWFIFFILLISSHPDGHKCIKPKEREYLTDHVPQSHVKKNLFAVPWKDIMTSKVTWAVICSQLGHDWGYFVMITCLPKYVAQVLQFSIKSNGIVTSLPFIAMFICTNLSGCFADYLIRNDKLEIGFQRKLWTFISAVGPGGFTVVASYAGCEKFLVILFFVLAMFTMGFYYSGQKLSPMDMSPAFSGTIMAVTNGLGSISGFLAPVAVGWMTPDATMGQWRSVFWLGFAILVISSIVFAIWGSADVQPFDPSYSGDKKQ